MRVELRSAILILVCLAGAPALAQNYTFDAASKTARTNVMLAESYLQKGDLATALDKASRAVQRDGKSPEAHAVLAMVYDRLDKQEQAAQNFGKAVKLAPESGVILNAYAAWHCQHGRYAEAQQSFVKALADPLYQLRYQAMFNAAQCAMLGGDRAAAENYYRGILQLDPNEPLALETLALLQFEKGDALRARAFLQRREAAAPATAQLLDLAARIEIAAGDNEAAARYRQRRQAEFPEASMSDADVMPPAEPAHPEPSQP